ncbi:MAG: YkgJ family cysteine cluster protein [Proteobacteria bacterium]|nr:YkgJ family cysteine cluster protein [Pseudomonadota bacterium]MBU1611856.1 YkgJ family cysteine cluster protein [Pseudomonadota bacterium]
MALDFTPYFKRYEAIMEKVEEAFGQIQSQTGDMVRCGKGCSDCCYALFDLTMVEAIYLSHHFRATFSGMKKSELMERADKADREVNRMKRQLFRATQEGVTTSEILRQVAETRMRCPLLGDDDLCELYEHRPLTCRSYGVPLAIGGEVRTCGKSGFQPGTPYPTIQIEKLQDSLMAISAELAKSINSRYVELGTMLLPPSMAIITEFDEEFLGVMDPGEKQPAPAGESLPMDCSGCDESQGSSACSSCKDNSFSITLGGPEQDEE